ncbi:C40 family peptidase [Blastococcus goldschmidtiae]|uniref:C40 family peptidase n=1 Tax=Blastococcus goldschmidtiae TaxID=3075546 RepID=A0ABU2K316_9ACTN|nr:C40 family peptidase [Blastococcus sp. DSM 46792]MDT0274580.1 C40 family peptidase [Blastococcus sp. DSM 46792]
MQSARTTPRRRSRALLAVGVALVAAATGVLAPAPAGATPGTAAEARELVQKAAQELTVVDEQLHEAELAVAAQREAAAAAAEQAAAAHAAMAVFEPRLRAIAYSGYTEKTQSRMAAFLTSESADELVQQMTTLDLIADHTNSVVIQADAAQDAAREAQAAADAAAATAEAGVQQLREQKAEVEKRAAAYQADFARLSAAEQERVTTAVAGRSLDAPSVDELPVVPGTAAAVAIQAALAEVGDAYAAGGTGPNAYDCSGLTSYAYAAAGVRLPHSSRAQSQLGRQVSRQELRPGDLVFYYTPISHVALYIGNGMIVHARTYGKPVAVTSVDQRGYRFGVRLGG